MHRQGKVYRAWVTLNSFVCVFYLFVGFGWECVVFTSISQSPSGSNRVNQVGRASTVTILITCIFAKYFGWFVHVYCSGGVVFARRYHSVRYVSFSINCFEELGIAGCGLLERLCAA